MPNHDEVLQLIQEGYYNPVDRCEGGEVVGRVLSEDIDFSHLQAGRGYSLGKTQAEVTKLQGRDAVVAFLDKVLPFVKEAELRHEVRELVTDGTKGAFLAQVSSNTSEEPARFMVWFELTDGLISRYTMRPL